MADDLRRAVTTIMDSLKFKIDKSEKGKDIVFTARSRDFGITDPDIQKEITKRQVAKGAMGAAILAADVFLNPENYTPEALGDKASRDALEVITRQGEKILNKQLPPGLNINIDYKGLGLEDVWAEGRLPAVGASYETRDPFGYGGGFRAEARKSQDGFGASIRYGVPTDKITEAIIGKPFARKAKGGKVKKYAKGGHVKQYSNAPREPRLK